MQRKRPRYYKGKLLKSEDLIQEQQYLDERDRQMNLLSHGSGILRGLTLTQQSDSVLRLSQGCAIDQDGSLIIVDSSCDIDLRELDGFEKIERFHGYLTLSKTYIPCDSVFCEFSERATHEEEDTWQDSYCLCIQEDVPIDEQYAPFFTSQTLLQEDGLTLRIYIPDPLPETGNAYIYIQEINMKNKQGMLKMELHSKHFMLTSMEKELGAGMTWQRYELQRDPNSGGTLTEVELCHICLEDGQNNLSVSDQTLMIEISRDIRKATLQRLRTENQFLTSVIVLGEVIFSYQNDHLRIDQLSDHSRTYAAHAQLDHQLTTLLNGIGYSTSSTEKQTDVMDKEKEVTSACGNVAIVFDDRMDTYVSHEITHGLGSGNVLVIATLEERVNSVPDTMQRLYGGDMSLFLKEAVQCAVCMYPQKGTFQIALRRASKSMQKKYCVHWYAQRYPAMDSSQDLHVHLQRLAPSTITTSPQHALQFIPIFNLPAPDAIVTFDCEEANGVINEEGRYIAPATPGVYQVCARYQDDVVYAYVKVKEP